MAGRIPQTFIDELVGRADIVEVLSARMALKKAGREYKGLCPFHGEKTASFTVSPDKGFYHCFGCGAHGTAIGFLMEHDHLNFVEAVENLAGMMGIEVPREAGGERDHGTDRLVDLLRRTAELYAEKLKEHPPAIEYLKNRGIDGETAKRYGIGYSPDSWDTVKTAFGDDRETQLLLQAAGLIIKRDDGKEYDRFRDRLMFPIRDTRGRVIAFGGRIMGKGEPKYLNSPETVVFSKRRELYGLYEARRKLRDIPRLVVVEGYMDVVALARHGIEYGVATLGTATTPEHLQRLFRVTEEVLFCFDGDRAGRQAAWRALETALPEARDGRQMRFMFLPDGEDPDSLVSSKGSKAFEEEIRKAVPMSDFLVAELRRDVDTDSVDGRARLAELAKPLISKVPAGVYRELLVERLASEVGIAGAKLAELLGDAPSGKTSTPKASRPVQVRQQELSLVARAIRALLHQPGLGELADPEALVGLDRPGSALLLEILEIVQSEPHLTSAVLLERLRTHRHIRHLERLLGSEHMEHAELDLQQEFSGCLAQLKLAALKQHIDELTLKAGTGLSSDEKRELVDSQRQYSELKRENQD